VSVLEQIKSPETPEGERQYTKAELMEFIKSESDHDTLISTALPRIMASSLKHFEVDQILKGIKQKTGASLTSLRADIQNKEDEEGATDLDIAREVIMDCEPKNILHCEGGFRLWRGKGVWESVDDQVIKKQVHTVLEQQYPPLPVYSSKVNSVTDLVRTETYKEGSFFSGRADIINVKNGELHFVDGVPVLKPHNRENYLTSQLNAAYDPEATAPRFMQFLNEVFKGDDDADDKITVLLQMMAYSLLQNCKYESFILLIGSGANGKSVLLEVLRALVGNKSASAVQPSQFDNKFQRGHLEGKLVNIVTEISEGHEIKDAELKAIVSGELTTAERKFQPPFEFQPYSTCWFGTNHMPHTRDFSDALFRRAIILTFNNSFYGKARDPKLKEKLVNELSGILNMSLTALTQLFKDGAFVEPESSQEAKRQWRVEADQVAQFTEEYCQVSAESQETSQELYNAYDDWANDAGISRRLNRNNFTKRLQKLGFAPKKGTGGVRTITGIKLIKVPRFYAR
tara:strand:+ start:3876 stop:5417 length:1542 start_codon:yes stop_codon:yes gene_type:complete